MLNKIKHSPGPWAVADNANDSPLLICSSASAQIVAELYGDCAETEENGRLIALAPELYELAWQLAHAVDYMVQIEDHFQVHGLARFARDARDLIERASISTQF